MGGGGRHLNIKLCGGRRMNKKGSDKRDDCGGKHSKLLAALTESGAEKSYRGRGLFKMVFGVDGMVL